ncbi:carboxypeptidase-like regulatory domain-containing protein, partial [Halieaceae bacterium]|nr:carboxypeptidase-like regulatory domain-containing protein [Halieaceae bacterium]
MKSIAFYAGIALSLVSFQSFAASVYLQVFLDEAPLQGVPVALDGSPLAATDGRGGAASALTPGSHVLTLTDDGVAFPVSFDSRAGEDVEVTVTFTAREGMQPGVNIRKFAVGDTSASGYITGRVTNTLDAPVAGANVLLESGELSALTDADGVFLLAVPRGLHVLKVIASDYGVTGISDVRVLADMGVSVAVKLSPADSGPESVALPSTQIEEVLVLGVFKATEDAAGMERFATSITNAIDIQMLERFGDSDVAAALN